MGVHSNIQWCDGTVNSSSGCAGCELARPSLPENDRVCWAYQLQSTRLSRAFAESHPHLYSPDFFEVRLLPGRAARAARHRDLRGVVRADKPWLPAHYPRLIFLSDMSDLLSPEISFDYIREEILNVVQSPPGARHIWLWLTKQAKRLAAFGEWMQEQGGAWPDNLWPGVSVTGRETAWRVDHLMKVRARRHFVSYEPAYSWVDFWARAQVPDWIICGGASGRGAPLFDASIATRLIERARGTCTRIFIKQLGRQTANVPNAGDHETYWRDAHGGAWEEWPEGLRVREFPELGNYNRPTAGIAAET